MSDQVDVTINDPVTQVINVTVDDSGAATTPVTVADPTLQVVSIDIAEPVTQVVDVNVHDPVTEVVQITVLGGGISNSSVPDGGATDQILAKRSPLNQDMHWVDNSYDASVFYTDTQISAHTNDTVDAHVAEAINFTAPGSGLISTWLTASEVETAIIQTASQLYAPDEAAMEAMMAAANALVGGAGQEFDNPDIFANDVIVTRHMLAGSISAAVLDVTTLNATLISANALYSTNYAYTSGPYSDAGTFFDLSNGDIISEEFTLIGGAVNISANATIGILTADQLASSAEVAAAEVAAQAAADAAETAAITSANAYADGEISAAEATAIATAEADATVKAQAAEDAAIAAAELYTNNSFTPGNVNPNVTDIDGGVITTGFINAGRIDAASITADKLDVTDLSVISADLGTVTAGDINIGSGNFTVSSAGLMTATGVDISGTLKGSEFELYDDVSGVQEVQSEWVSDEDAFDAGVINNALLFRHNDLGGSNNISGLYWASDNGGVSWIAGSSGGSRGTSLTLYDDNIIATTGPYNMHVEDTEVEIANATGTNAFGVNSSGPYINGNVNANGAVFTNVNEIQLDNGSQSDPSLFFDANSTTGLYSSSDSVAVTNDGSIVARFAADRLYLYGGTGNADYIGAVNSTYFYMSTASDYFYFNKPLRVDTGEVTSHNESLKLQDTLNTVLTLEAAAYANGSVLVTAGTTGGAGDESALRILTNSSANSASGGTAGMLFQTTFSTDRHVHARVYYDAGDELGFRNYENTAWVPLKASAFTVASDAKYKKRIRKGRDEHHPFLEGVLTGDRQLAFDKHRAVQTIVYDDESGEHLYEWAGCTGLRTVYHETRDECIRASCPGKDNMVIIEHHCDDYVCGGTKESPCWLIEKRVDRPGFLAQNMEVHYPKVVNTDFNGEERSIDLYGVIAELWNTVDHLIEECEDLREAIVLTSGTPNPKDRPRGGTILPPEKIQKGRRSDGKKL